MSRDAKRPPDPPGPEQSELVLYQADDGNTRVQIRLFEGTVWLTQKQLAELYQVAVPTISEHLHNIFEEGEQAPEATVRKFRTVRTEGNRSISRTLDHYSLPVVISVGYRVRSLRGTQFRQWATARLEEYAIKGFTLDDQRLKNPPGVGAQEYFDELLARIRDIRSSEKVFYRKVLDIYATSMDYDPRIETSQLFFKTVQNKMHWAAHGQTAAEVIESRADASKPSMGLTTWSGPGLRKADVAIAKNYLGADELEALNRIVSAYLEFAELQAMNRKPMYMADWIAKLDDFLKLSDRQVLRHAGKVSHEDAIAKAELEYDRFASARAALPAAVDNHFEDAVREVNRLDKTRITANRSDKALTNPSTPKKPRKPGKP